VGVLVDNLVSPSHSVVLVLQGTCVAGCMLHVTYMTQTSALRHAHVLNSVHVCLKNEIMLVTINTGTQQNATQIEFVGVRMSVLVTQLTFLSFHSGLPSVTRSLIQAAVLPLCRKARAMKHAITSSLQKSQPPLRHKPRNR
jgi:hypothetical protein